MPLIETKGAASAQGFGEFAASSGAVNYIEDVFSTYLYTGTGSAQTITNGIDFSTKGGLLWLKARNDTRNNWLYDTNRGYQYGLRSDLNFAQSTTSDALTAFNSNGFSIGTSGNINTSGNTLVSWSFAEQKKFFDVVTYTGSGGTQAIAHNLGSVPGCIIIKAINSTEDWNVYHRSTGATTVTFLNLTNAAAYNANFFPTEPTSTEFYVGDTAYQNAEGSPYIAYLFAHNAGGFGLTGTDNVISCGSFTTNGSGNTTVTLGYEPQWILMKDTQGSASYDNWYIIDNMRGFLANGNANELYANKSNAENANVQRAAPTATGFIPQGLNASRTYIYIAIRRGPMKVPTSGTSVFTPTIGANLGAGGGLIANAGFPPDLHLEAWKNTVGKYWFDRLRGANQYIQSTGTSAEATDTGRSLANMLGMTYSTTNNFSNAVVYDFRRAPSFFDEVCDTGTGVTHTVSHNLTVAPELIIRKKRSAAGDNWIVGSLYDSVYGGWTGAFYLNTTNAYVDGAGFWNNTAPTSSVFTVSQGNGNNDSGATYVNYLFATCAGVSKVGTYTGTGALKTVNCGFTSGARFVLIKRTDSTGDWYVYDSARGITSGNDPYLLLNSTAAETTGTNYVDTDTTGFKVTASAPAGLNASGGTYIFLAIA